MTMSSSFKYPFDDDAPASVINAQGIEDSFLAKLAGLKYLCRSGIRDRAALEHDFREKFEALNRVRRLISEDYADKVIVTTKISSN